VRSMRRCSARSAPARSSLSRSSWHTFVAHTARETVGVEALEQELRDAPRDSELVPEAGDRDRRQRPDRLDALLVELLRDREPVADPVQPACPFQERAQLAVLDLAE